jgi:excisionase family DNA binding protein
MTAPATSTSQDVPPPAPAEAAPAEAPSAAPAVSVDEAAAALGVSTNTIRRWLKTGALRGERARRPQGALWRVHLPVQVPVASDRHVPDGTFHEGPAPAAGTSQPAPAALEVARAEALQTSPRPPLHIPVASMANDLR